MRKSDDNRKGNVSFRQASLIVAVSLGLGILFNILFFDTELGISMPIFTLVGLVSLWLLARRYNVTIPKQAALMAVPLLFFSGMVFVRAGGLITFLNVIASLYLTALMLHMVYRPNLQQYVLRDYLSLPIMQLAAYVQGARRTIGEVAGMRAFVRKHERFPQVVRGIFIAAPLLLLFTVLFSSADVVFRRYVGDVFSMHINGELVWRLIIIAFVTCVGSGVYTYLLRKPATRLADGDSKQASDLKLGYMEAAILFGSLNALFVLFIMVQLAYLFGGARNIGAEYTYAEYARKGFFELIAVAAISFVVIWVAEKALLRQAGNHTRQFRWLSAALIAQVMIIMISAFKRLALYENAYGFTTLRFYSHLAIVWLAVVLCLMLYKICKDQRESTFMYAVFASLLAVLAFVNVLNVDGFVARKNINRYEAAHKLDVRYITELSDDAIPETTRLLHAPDPRLRLAYAGVLYGKRLELAKKEQAWQSRNLSRAHALDVLQANDETLRRNRNQDMQYLINPFTTPQYDDRMPEPSQP